MKKHTKSQRYLFLFLASVLLITTLVIIAVFRMPQEEEKHVPIMADTKNIISGSFDSTKLKSNDEWKKILTPIQYHILREEGTELPFSGGLLYEKRQGTYVSAGCNEPLFRSEQKYESGTGWPSFWAPISPEVIVLKQDNSIPSDSRIEVLDRCGGHLGHVFEDGPPPSGQRYCMNSGALVFIPDSDQ